MFSKCKEYAFLVCVSTLTAVAFKSNIVQVKVFCDCPLHSLPTLKANPIYAQDNQM